MTVAVCEGVSGVEFWEPFVTGSPEHRRIHRSVTKIYGPAKDYSCIQCSGRAKEWSWQHGEDPNLVSSYEPMCCACHRLYDMTEEWRDNIGYASSRRTHSNETRSKIAAAAKHYATTYDVRVKIYDLYSTGLYTQAELAIRFGIGTSSVGRIIKSGRM